jgi:hypothetical protein
VFQIIIAVPMLVQDFPMQDFVSEENEKQVVLLALWLTEECLVIPFLHREDRLELFVDSYQMN